MILILIRYVSPTRKCKQSKLKRKKIKSEFKKNRTVYPLRNLENILPVENYLKRLKRKCKSETPNEENFNKIIALEPSTEPKLNSLNSFHLRQRYKRKAKQFKEKCNHNQLKFKGREPSYLKCSKTVCDEEFLKEVPEFNFRTKVSERDKTKRREEIFDKIMQQIPDNDKYYISYDPRSDSYYIKADKKVIYPNDEENKKKKKKNFKYY